MILTTQNEFDMWLTAPTEEAPKLPTSPAAPPLFSLTQTVIDTDRDRPKPLSARSAPAGRNNQNARLQLAAAKSYKRRSCYPIWAVGNAILGRPKARPSWWAGRSMTK